MGLWDWMEQKPGFRRLTIVYSPKPEDRSFIANALTEQKEGIEVSVAVLDTAQSRAIFDVPMGKRGIQPVWVRIVNNSPSVCRLQLVSIDPNYFSAYEAAAVNHYSFGKRLLGFGLLGWIFFPLLLLIPLKIIGAHRANRKIDEFFRQQGFKLKPIPPGQTSEGFVFTAMDVGTKVIHPRILRLEGPIEFDFNVPVPGINADYQHRDFEDMYPPSRQIECDLPALRERLKALPRAVSNAVGFREGDPLNLVVVGDFSTILTAFATRWDETECITLATCLKTFKAFLSATEYRYSPVSSLYLFGRSQDFALQRIRSSINERLHLRLWITELRHEGKPVWVGQVSRDIGVRFTHKTWNLTTHRIDPDVDESRDYVLEDLLESERLALAGFVPGVGDCDLNKPRRNLTGDPYFTDGYRGLAILSVEKCKPKLIPRE